MIPVKFEVVEQEYSEHYADDPTPRYMILVDGDPNRILCSEMTEKDAEWLAEVLNENGLPPGRWV